MNIWVGTLSSLKMFIDVKDLAVFKSPGNSNISYWVDVASLPVAYSDKAPGAPRAPLDEVSAQAKGVGTFSIRAHIIPTSGQTASFWKLGYLKT